MYWRLESAINFDGSYIALYLINIMEIWKYAEYVVSRWYYSHCNHSRKRIFTQLLHDDIIIRR